MQPEKISIRYKWNWLNLNDWIEIEELWNNLLEFSKLSKSILKEVWHVDIKDINLRIVWLRNWSIIVDIIINNVWNILEWFKDLYSLLDYLHTIDLEIYNTAVNFIDSSVNSYKELENWGKDHPVFLWLMGILIGSYWWSITKFLKKIVKISKDVKDNKKIDVIKDNQEINLSWEKVKWSIAKRTKKLVNQWKYIDFLEPFIDDKVKSIEIWQNENYEKIDENDYQQLLWKWFEILPQYINGSTYDFVWSFTAMQSNIWETMTLKSIDLKDRANKPMLFSCIPDDNCTSEQYKNYYWESMVIKVTAEVIRESIYKKPKLKIKNIVLMNPTLL